LHFTSETKPWNFHFLHQREWRENYDGHLFGLWTRALRSMRAQLATGDLWKSDDWENKGRVEDICDHRLKRNYGRRYPKTTQFTVIVNLNNETDSSLQRLQHILRVYASSNKVARIFINGNMIKDEQGKRVVLNTSYLRSLRLRKTVKAIGRGSFSSANNKFNPIQGITTDAVYLADENVSLGLYLSARARSRTYYSNMLIHVSLSCSNLILLNRFYHRLRIWNLLFKYGKRIWIQLLVSNPTRTLIQPLLNIWMLQIAIV
jgi:hypothetical protein